MFSGGSRFIIPRGPSNRSRDLTNPIKIRVAILYACPIRRVPDCYMLIQILQSIGQLLTSGARPVAGRLGPWYGTDRRRPRFPPIYKPLVSRRLGELHL